MERTTSVRERSRVLTADDLGILVALAALIFGTWARLIPPYRAGFPINDGGLFYVIMRAIRSAGYSLPPTVSYNGLQLPFAYPPLGFYLGTALADLLHVTDLVILQWLPAVVLIATIPAFFSLARTITGSAYQAGIGTLFFALLPRSINFMIMGGGLTRSPGELFMILALQQVYLLFTVRSRRSLVLGSTFSALLVLSHPEAAFHVIAISLLFLILLSPNKRGILEAGALGAIVACLTAFWWMRVLSSYGIGPFLSASRTGLNELSNILYAFLMVFGGEPFMTLVPVLAVIGIAFLAAQRKALIPLWFMLPFLVEFRNAPNIAIVPMCMLAAISVTDVLGPALSQAREATGASQPYSRFPKPLMGLLVFIGIYLLLGMTYIGGELGLRVVSPANRAAYAWIRENTEPDSTFLVLTGSIAFFEDGIQEWFPALTDRRSVATPQGTEWLQGVDFRALGDKVQEIQGCLHQEEPLACVDENTTDRSFDYEYIYIARKPIPPVSYNSTTGIHAAERILAELSQTPQKYQRVFQNAEVVIFRRLK